MEVVLLMRVLNSLSARASLFSFIFSLPTLSSAPKNRFKEFTIFLGYFFSSSTINKIATGNPLAISLNNK
jgi:hypothetical protein